jgi:signal recognition particle GTPase
MKHHGRSKPYRYLEERTAVTIEKATSRLQDGDRKMKIADDKIQELERALLESQVSYLLLNGLIFDLCEGECRVVWGGQQ